MAEDLLEHDYDPLMSKFCSSLLWFVCRLSENGITDIPSEITNPLEPSATDAMLVRPVVIEYLTSGSVYLNVCKPIYKAPLYSLWDLIQRLSQNGVYVMDDNDEAVTDQDLTEKFPFKISSHLALMDAIMMVYSNNIVNVQMIVNAVRNFSTFNASKELPFDLEDALLLWLNKVNQINTVEYSKTRTDHHDNEGEDQQKYRFHKNQLVEKKIFPALRDINDCFKDGITLLSLILFYYPEQLSIDSVNLSSQLSLEERFSNIETFRSLCADHVCTSVFAIPAEDFFHAKDEFKQNFLALLCEIFTKLNETRKRQHSQNDNLPQQQLERYEAQSHSTMKNDVGTYKTKQNDGNVKSNQPLLSKRSKKQLAKFEQQSVTQDKPSTALQLDDLDLKQSQMIPSTLHRGQLQNASHAWESGSDSGIEKKQSKISLDFRPDSGSSYRSMTRSSGSSENGQSHESNVNTQSHESNLLTSSTETYVVSQAPVSCETTPPKPVIQNTLSYSDGVKLVEDAMVTSINKQQQQSFSSIKNEEPKLADFSQHPENPNVSFGDSKESAENVFYALSKPQPPERSITPHTAQQAIDQPSTSSIYSISSLSTSEDFTSDNLIYQSNPAYNEYSEHEYVDEDALSTITEATEPDAPSLYSFHSSSASTVNDSEDERLNFSPSMEGGGFFLDDFDHKMFPGHIQFVDNLQNRSPPGSSKTVGSKSSEILSSEIKPESVHSSGEFDKTLTEDKEDMFDIEPPPSTYNNDKMFEQLRNSYTVRPSSVDTAIANGLPVINRYPSDNIRQYSSPNVASTVPVLSCQPEEKEDKMSNPVVQLPLEQRASSSDINSDLEEGPLNLRFPSQNSINSLGTYSSSSGISVDDGRFHVASDDQERPANVVYSSLSETTASPGSVEERGGSQDVLLVQSKENQSRDINHNTDRDNSQEQKPALVNSDNVQSVLCQNSLNKSLLYKEKFPLKEMQPFLQKAVFGVWPFVENYNSITKYENTKHVNNGGFYDDPISPVKTTWLEIFASSQKKECSIEEEFNKLHLRKKKYKSSTKKWIDFVSNNNEKDDDSNDEPLSTRLAALRMQLEEKRRQFEEEKKQKQQAWSQERAKVLKDAFYNINGKENQDPSVTPGVTSWEVHFDNNLIPDDDEQKENKDFNPTGSKPYVSPRDYICQKQMQSKQKSVNDGLWFVGFEEGQEENFLSQQSLEQPTQSSNITQKHQQNTPINTETHTKPKEHLPRTKLTNDEQLYSPSNEKMHNVPYEDQNEFSFKEELAKQEDLMGSSDSLSRLKALRNVTSDMVNRSSHQDTLSEMRRLSLQHNDLRDSRNSLQQERKREDRYSQPQPQPHSKPKPHFQQRSVSYDATSPRQRQLDQQKSHYSLQHDLHKAGQKDSKQDLSVLRSQTSVEHKEYEQQLSNLRSNITDHLQENINNEPQFHANLEPQYHVNTENRSNDQILTYNKLISDENEIHYKDTVSDDHPNANLPLKSSTAYHDLQSASSLKQNFNNELVDINQQANNTVVTDHHFISPSLNKQHGEYLSSNEPREQYNEEFTDQSNEEFTDPTNTRRKLSDNTEIYQQPYKEFSQQSNEIHQTFIQNGSKQQQTNTTYIQNQNGGKQQQTDITYIQNQNGANPQQTDITYIQNQNNNLEHTNQTYIQNNNVQQTFQPPNETHIQGGDRSDDYQYSEHQPVMFNDQYNDNKVPAEEMPLRSEDFSQNHQQSTQANNVHNNRNSNIHNENPHHYKEEKSTLSGLSSLTPTDTNASQNIRREVGELHNAADEQLSTPVKLVPQKDPVTEEEKPTAWALTFGEDFQSPEMTPEQKKKRDRFLRNRIKKQEEEKAKKEAELEKKRKKEERAAEQKLKEEEEQTRQLERLKEAELEEATNQLQQEVYSKRLHEMTYHTTPQRPMSQRLPMRDSSERLVSQPRVQSASAASSGYRRTNSNTLTTPDNGEQNPSQFAEYKGPAMYTKPSGKSNRKIIQNAVMHCCLCGEVNKEAKRKCLEALNQSGGNHFLVLFREGLKFRSVYEYYPETETVTRIYGIGPKSISTKMISKYLKYNSGGKEFNVLDTKHLSIQIDGIMIKKELWEKKPGTTPSKVDLSRKKTTPQRPVNR